MNAIILAAGLGSRFKEMTENNHKSLLPINGTPNLERTLGLLKEANITDIHIITGYRASSFNYLVDLFPGINLHYNEKYAEYNNIYSFYKALPFFGDSFVIDADTVFNQNLFFEKPDSSCYFTKLRVEDDIEWCPITDEAGQVIEMEITNEKIPSMTGVTYWTKEDADKIRLAFTEFLSEETLLNSKLYWDNIPLTILDSLTLTTKELTSQALFEMDTQENYFFILNELQKS